MASLLYNDDEEGLNFNIRIYFETRVMLSARYRVESSQNAMNEVQQNMPQDTCSNV